MPELEDRLRAAVGRRSDAYDPAADLPDRIDARVRRQRRRRQAVRGGLLSVAVAAAAAVTVVALVAADGDDERIRTTDVDGDVSTRPPSTSSTTGPATTATTATTSTTSSTTTTASSVPTGTGPGSGTGDLSLVTRQGIGPITAGMTLREAQAASGLTLTATPVGGGSCLEAPLGQVDTGVVLVVEAVGADPLDGIVRATAGSVLQAADGAMVGQSRAELLAAMGEPTRDEPGPADWGAGAEILVFEEGGFAYGVLVVDDLVLGVQSGDPAWIADPDGCPG